MHNFRLLTLIFGLVYVTIGVGSPLMTLYLEELGASYARISLMMTTVAATALVSNYYWGRLSDRVGRRKPFLIGALIALIFSYTALSRVPNATWAWPILVINGAALAAYTTPSLALIGDLLADSPNRGRQMGIYRGIASLTFAIGAVTGGRIADATSIATALAICAGFYAAALLVTFLLGEAKAVQKQIEATTTPIPAEERVPKLFLAGVALWIAGIGAAISMWPNYMSSLGYSKSTISALWGWAALWEVPGMVLVGHLSDLFGRVPLLAAGGLGIGLVLTGYIVLSSFLPGLIGVQFLRGFAYASYTASAMTFAAEWGSARSRGHNSGIYNAATGGGQLLGTLMGGTLAQLFGFQALFAVCACLSVASALCFWQLRRAANRRVAELVG
ncbi:MAG: MFS transporter [Caldilineaceae bacterium]|nr:MFS transporter [Caldilineaceae bacterium]